MRDQNFKAAARLGHLDGIIAQSKMCRELVRNNQLMSVALIEASMNGHINVVQWLAVNTEADFNYKGEITQPSAILKKNQSFSFSPLIAACYNGHLNIVKYQVEICRANVNLPDKGGYTPLTVACHRAYYS